MQTLNTRLKESLLDDEDILMDRSDKVAETYQIKEWISKHNLEYAWGDYEKSDIAKTMFTFKKDELIEGSSKFTLIVDGDIPKYVNITSTNPHGTLNIDVDSKSLDIYGIFKNFKIVNIDSFEQGGSINFKTPMHLEYLNISAPYIKGFDLSKIKVDELILEDCYRVDLSKCKFPKGDYKFRLSTDTKNLMLAEVYKKYGLPDIKRQI